MPDDGLSSIDESFYFRVDKDFNFPYKRIPCVLCLRVSQIQENEIKQEPSMGVLYFSTWEIA